MFEFKRLPWLGCMVFALALLAVGGAGKVRADDFADGRRAFLDGDYARAMAVWRPLAEASDPAAQFGLGTLYHEGAGVEPDPAGATRWFRLAAEQGYAPAQFNLGNAYKHGRGVAKDDSRANEWWLKAAEQGFAPAQYNLGTQYYFGNGVAKNRKRAIGWYRKAALNGHAGARRLFGIAENGGGPSNPESGAAKTAGGRNGAEGSATRIEGETWLLTQDPRHYTVQVAALGSADAAITYARQPGVAGAVAYFSFSREGKKLFPVVFGAYRDRLEAERVVAGLPPKMRQTKPWVRRFADIQKTIRENRGDPRQPAGEIRSVSIRKGR